MCLDSDKKFCDANVKFARPLLLDFIIFYITDFMDNKSFNNFCHIMVYYFFFNKKPFITSIEYLHCGAFY